MINVLGYTLKEAKQLLESNGLKVIILPCDDKPAADADADIIVRQRPVGENTAELLYGKFKTKANLKDA